MLSFEKSGPPIAAIKNNKRTSDGRKIKMRKVYVTDDDSALDESVLTFDSPVIPIPYKMEGQRSAIYVMGASGSGKSTYIKNSIVASKPGDRRILLFTTADDLDPVFEDAFENFKKVNYMKDVDSLYTLTVEDLKDCLCIFDDFDCSTDVNVNAFMVRLVKSVLENGRKLNISLYCVSHNPRDFIRTRTIILECDTFVCFPQTNRSSVLNFLKIYFDDNKDFLDMVKNTRDNGRFTFCTLHRNVPRYMITHKSIRLLA